MAHISEGSRRLAIKETRVSDKDHLFDELLNFNDVCLLKLPGSKEDEYGSPLEGVEQLVAEIVAVLGPQATLVTLGEAIDLVHVHTSLSSLIRYQLWIAIKRSEMQFPKSRVSLPHHHFGALVHTKYNASLRHTKTRMRYTYCPVCNKTTKDYGGKKHTYHETGTLISDVWRDVSCDLDGDVSPVTDRFADLFGLAPYRELRVIDCGKLELKRVPIESINGWRYQQEGTSSPQLTSELILGDSLKELRKIPDNSIDFIFADPPYNLRKKYAGYNDALEITKYFTWCDEWIAELSRVLRPGRTCAILNIPILAIRHFLCLEKFLTFQNWIVWDALSFPVRLIMPSHYTVLCFSKGKPRNLPGLSGEDKQTDAGWGGAFRPFETLIEGYCLRQDCVRTRRALRVHDHDILTDLWWDIHRLKHNSRRVNHPCQLPPQLMYRLVSLFTQSGEMVLDCFDGVGTSTLVAHQLGRAYMGIEIAEPYHKIARARHEEIEMGLNPFRKVERVLTAKNSPVPRMPKQKYAVPKKTLQIEVRKVTKLLGHLPSREELQRHGRYPIKYYNQYFVSWGEVCAAARTTGMSEDRIPPDGTSINQQLELFVMEATGKYKATRRRIAIGKKPSRIHRSRVILS